MINFSLDVVEAYARMRLWAMPWGSLWEVRAFQRATRRVHLWRANLEAASEIRRPSLILSENEQERAAWFHFQRDRRCFIVRRALLRMLRKRYLQITPSKIEYS